MGAGELKIPNLFAERFVYRCEDPEPLVSIRGIGSLIVFAIGGLVAIIVGSFMIRGTMHLWDNDDENDKEI